MNFASRHVIDVNSAEKPYRMTDGRAGGERNRRTPVIQRAESRPPHGGNGKGPKPGQTDYDMWRLIKVVLFLLVIGFVALAGYAYLADLEPEPHEIRTPVILDAK